MAVPLVVPDASVLLKWALPSDDEPDADRALLLRAAALDETVHALVPALWLYEVGNTVARRFPAHAEAWLSALMKFGVEEAPPSPAWLAKTLELTSRYEVSFYDAAYHALALVHKGLFVTADTKYIGRATKSGSVITTTLEIESGTSVSMTTRLVARTNELSLETESPLALDIPYVIKGGDILKDDNLGKWRWPGLKRSATAAPPRYITLLKFKPRCLAWDLLVAGPDGVMFQNRLRAVWNTRTQVLTVRNCACP